MASPSFYLVLSVLLSGLLVMFLSLALLKKNNLRFLLAVLMASFSIANSAWLLVEESQTFSSIGSIAYPITFPLATLVVILFLHPNIKRQALLSLIMLLPFIGIGAWATTSGIGADGILEYPLVSLSVLSCTCIGIMEAFFGWFGGRIFRRQCFLFMLALTVLIVTGPLYAFELELLGYQSLKGAILGAPLVGGLLLASLYWADPAVDKKPSLSPSPRSMATYRLKPGECYAISEKRPKYCYTFFRDVANAGNPSLLVTSEDSGELGGRPTVDGFRRVELATKDTKETLKVTNLARLHNTIVDIIDKDGNPVVLIDALHYLLSNNDLQDVVELVERIVRFAHRKNCWVLLSFSLLTEDEKSELLSLDVLHLKVPSPEDVVKKILMAHTGQLSSHMVKLSCKILKKRFHDLTVEDVPEISKIVTNAVRSLGQATHETAIMKNWETQAKGLRDSLYHFCEAPLSFLTTDEWRNWNPLDDGKQQRDVGRKMGESAKRAEKERDAIRCQHGQPELHNEVVDIFTRHLGEFGKDLLVRECAFLRIEPNTMTSEDVEKLAERAEKTVSELGAFIDIPLASDMMKIKAENLKDELEVTTKEEIECCPE